MSVSPDTVSQVGVQQLREVYDQWILVYEEQQSIDGEKNLHGVMVQEQSAPQSLQRVLAIELKRLNDRLEGVLVLPFGLALEQGVTFWIDEGEPWSQAFRTSLSIGTIVSLEFDKRVVGALRTGTMLYVKAMTFDSGKEIGFVIPLSGFASAHDRLVSLIP